MEDMQGAAASWTTEGGEGSLWEAPPPGVATHLIKHGHLISNVRLVNTKWCKEVDGAVQRLQLRLYRLPHVEVGNNVRSLFARCQCVDEIVCVKSPVLDPIVEAVGGRLVHLKLHRCGLEQGNALSQLSNLKSLEVLRCFETLGNGGHLPWLPSLSGLTNLKLDGFGTKLVNLDALGSLTDLVKLTVSNGHISTTDYLERLTKLVELHFNHHHGEGQNLGVISALTNLTHLDVSFSSFGDSHASCLVHLVNLRTLSLEQTKVTDDVVHKISHLAKLTSLDVSRADMTSIGLESIACFTGLEDLGMGDLLMDLGPATFLSKLTNLTKLYVDNYIEDEAMRTIAATQSLRDLLFEPRFVSNDAFSTLSNLSRLERLHLVNYGRDDDTVLSAWGCMLHLTKLHLFGDGWGDETVANMTGLSNLQCLTLETSNMTDCGLDHLTNLQAVTRLHVEYANISNDSIQRLSSLANLKDLKLGNLDITDDGIEHLTKLEGLTRLHLFGIHVSDDGIEKLSALPNLKALGLLYLDITENGILHLTNLQGLTSLHLKGNKGIDFVDETMTTIDNLKEINLTSSPWSDDES